MKPAYEYQAILERVVDGDTVYLRVDLGFRVSCSVEFRLARINAPELRGETLAAGRASSVALEAMLINRQLLVRSDKSRDKYGRWIGDVFFYDGTAGAWKSASDELIMMGHAVPYVTR